MASKKAVIVDTDIFIKVFRGNLLHKKNLDALAGRISISIISVLELYQGVNTKQKKYGLEKQLRAYQILDIDTQISGIALLLAKKYLPAKQLLPPDCLIAATAIKYRLELFIDNKKDFNFIKGINFYIPK